MDNPNDHLDRTTRRWIAVACLVACLGLVGVAVYLVVFHCSTCEPQARLSLLAGYGTLILLFFFGFLVLMEMALGNIDLTQLLSETTPDGKTCSASMSRFQLLVFTFTIGLSLFLLVVYNKKFPEVPAAVVTLLGISASTYAVSKGIQASSAEAADGDGGGGPEAETTTTTVDPATGRTTTTVHHPATGHTKTVVHDPASGQTTTTVHNPHTVTTTTTVDPPPPAPAP